MRLPEGAMEGKVVLVTGATDGLGRETVLTLAGAGATVVAAGRDPRKIATTVRDLVAQTGNTSVEGLVADLSSQEQVRRLAREFLDRYERLDVLVNNAGAIFERREETEDGIERTFAVNHLAPFLLTSLLLDVILESAPARVVTVSSVGHRSARLDFDDLQNARSYDGNQAYAQSKLANVLFTYELARRLEGTGVTANAADPGMARTNIGTNNKSVRAYLQLLAHRAMADSVERGARTSIYLASSPEVEGISGAYFADCKQVLSSPASYNGAVARRLWSVSEELTGLVGMRRAPERLT
jgi:NAD(P)-dependent dehydrogenase (short-subunit alcohol dehydrogenase family)